MGGANPGFIGFGSSGIQSEIVPLDLGVDSGSAAENIPGEVRMTMRKMAKRDVTTKLKVSHQG